MDLQICTAWDYCAAGGMVGPYETSPDGGEESTLARHRGKGVVSKMKLENKSSYLFVFARFSQAGVRRSVQRKRCPAPSSTAVTLFCNVCWQCSYIPPCARDDQENSENVTYKQKYWKEKVGSQPFTCYFNQHLRPDDVMLKRTHDETVLLHCFLWPLVTFLVGVLIVVLTICAKSLAVRAEAIKKKKHL
ncbi:PREDICTED: calcium-activated potassium channel subunit beta-4 [Merops nubicus]|uniref:calcium-activated potassium channel subunit beta-4 n=1 Tax=Merops nubicus TaxID=57421 RepID=UPI0004F03072|nr:PREDICTED: calcium-activated potassium channel subunit beta-4 [Merops nubicus]